MDERSEKEIIALLKNKLSIVVDGTDSSGFVSVKLMCEDTEISSDGFYLPTTDA